MYRGPSRYYKVVYSRKKQFAVWHADAPLRTSWQDTGHYGTEIDCWDYVDSREGAQGFLFYFPNAY
jgi:uncharacterized protein YbdZ (MbtH family)